MAELKQHTYEQVSVTRGAGLPWPKIGGSEKRESSLTRILTRRLLSARRKVRLAAILSRHSDPPGSSDHFRAGSDFSAGIELR